MNLLKNYQHKNEKVIMVGDGVNDVAVLAGADVSFAVFDSAPLASASADILLLSPSLAKIEQSIMVATKTRRIIKQNITWTICYNFLVIPIAAMSYTPPWLAAIGMSLSSLIVVINAQRLRSKTLGNNIN